MCCLVVSRRACESTVLTIMYFEHIWMLLRGFTTSYEKDAWKQCLKNLWLQAIKGLITSYICFTLIYVDKLLQSISPDTHLFNLVSSVSSDGCSPSSLSLSLSILQLFKEELTQVKEGMKHINDLAHQLAISDVHLSMENARALEHLNGRWKVLQVAFAAGFALSVWLLFSSSFSGSQIPGRTSESDSVCQADSSCSRRAWKPLN